MGELEQALTTTDYICMYCLLVIIVGIVGLVAIFFAFDNVRTLKEGEVAVDAIAVDEAIDMLVTAGMCPPQQFRTGNCEDEEVCERCWKVYLQRKEGVKHERTNTHRPI